MKTSFSTFGRHLLFAALPATVLLSSCGKDDNNDPSQGQVQLVHAAAAANVRVKALIDDKEVGQLDYGQSSNYLTVNAGSPTLKINVASSSQTATTKQLTIADGQKYSVFAYTPSTSTPVDVLQVTDDLTDPTSGQAKIRLVNLGLNVAAPVKLSQTTAAGTVDIPSVSANFASASNFVNIPTGTYNLLVTSGSASTTVASVGDGSGSGTGTKNYEAGKIYTVVLRGISNNLDPNLQPKALLITNK